MQGLKYMPDNAAEWMKQMFGPIEMLGAKLIKFNNIKSVPCIKKSERILGIFLDTCILLCRYVVTVDCLQHIHHVHCYLPNRMASTGSSYSDIRYTCMYFTWNCCPSLPVNWPNGKPPASLEWFSYVLADSHLVAICL